jgi:hypothetical protein
MPARKPAPAKLADLPSTDRKANPKAAGDVKGGGIKDGTSNTIMFAEAGRPIGSRRIVR